jgi:Holliday junction resolvase
MRPWARKVDRNQAAIVKALRAAGCTVLSLASVGKGCPDLLIGYGGTTFLIEVKSPRSLVPGAGGSLREKVTARTQAEWREKWRGGPVVVVRSVDEALAAVRDVHRIHGAFPLGCILSLFR